MNKFVLSMIVLLCSIAITQNISAQYSLAEIKVGDNPGTWTPSCAAMHPNDQIAALKCEIQKLSDQIKFIEDQKRAEELGQRTDQGGMIKSEGKFTGGSAVMVTRH